MTRRPTAAERVVDILGESIPSWPREHPAERLSRCVAMLALVDFINGDERRKLYRKVAALTRGARGKEEGDADGA